MTVGRAGCSAAQVRTSWQEVFMTADALPFPTSPRERNDQAPLGPSPTYDEVLDLAVEYTFPASDPIAVDSCCTSAERAARAKSTPPHGGRSG
jgi:hypothetical protein